MPPLQDSEQSIELREAEITVGTGGDPVGSCLYLTPTDLKALGIDPTTTDQITVSIDEDTEQLALHPVDNDEDDQP